MEKKVMSVFFQLAWAALLVISLLYPRSGTPVEHAPVAVSVVARDAMHADAWATALTVLGEDAGFALAQRQGLAVRYLGRDGDGRLRERMTDAFRAHLAQ